MLLIIKVYPALLLSHYQAASFNMYSRRLVYIAILFIGLACQPVSANSETLNQLVEKIADIETHHGPYAREISELSESIARQMAELNYHDEALIAYRRAAHIEKVNHGLKTARLAGLMHAMAYSYVQINEIELANNVKRTAFSIDLEATQKGSPAALSVLRRIATWHSTIMSKREFNYSYQHIASSLSALNRILSSEFHHFPVSLEDIKHYQLANYQMLNATLAKIDSELNFSSLKDSKTIKELEHNRTANQTHTYLRVQRKMLEILNRLTSKQQIEQQLHMQVLIGDWQILFNDFFRARKTYNHAWQQAAQYEKTHIMQVLFREPVRLPETVTALTPSEDNRYYIKIPIIGKVDRRGKMQKIRVDKSKAPNDLSKRAMQIAISNTRRSFFRPAMNSGKIIVSPAHQFWLIVEQ